MSEKQRAAKFEELLSQLPDPEIAAINTVAERYAAPMLQDEYLRKYANASGLNKLLLIPNIPRDAKKQIIANDLTAELRTAFAGVGDPRIPSAIAELVSEQWCDRLPLPNSPGDWIDALNSLAGNPGYQPELKREKPDRPPKRSWSIIVWGILALISISYLVLSTLH